MYQRKKRKSTFRKSAFWILFFLVIAGFFAGWYFREKTSKAPPQFHFMLISVNGEPRKLLSSEVLSLHPKDRVKILELSTNILLNLGVRLVTEGFDVNALRFEEMELARLLPEGKAFERYRSHIQVKLRNQDLGYVDWDIAPYAEDWLEKADRTIDPERRVDVLVRAREIHPDDKRLERRLLDEYKSLKRWKEVASMLEDMAEKGGNGQLLSELLEVYTVTNNKKGMVSALERILKRSPEDVNARTRLAEILEELGDRNAAIREYEILSSQVGQEARLPFHKRLGYLYSKTGEYEKAISSYLKAAKLDPSDANLFYNLSYLYEKTNQKEEANVYLSKAVELRSEDMEGRMRLAKELVEKGDLKKAEEYLSEVLEGSPKSLEALALMAKVAEKQRDKKKLKEIYERILTLDPENETVIYNLGVLEYEEGNLTASLPYFEKYVMLHPKDTEVQGILFEIYKREKDPQKAVRQARMLLELNPKLPDPYHYLFEYLNAQGDYKEITGIMERGLKEGPKSVDLREYLLLAYLKTGDEDGAIKQMEEIVKERPKDTDMWLRLAKLQEKVGRYPEAIKAYGKVLELSPGHEEAGEAYLRLRLKGVPVEGKG